MNTTAKALVLALAFASAAHVAALANHYRMAGAAADGEKTIDYSIRAGRIPLSL